MIDDLRTTAPATKPPASSSARRRRDRAHGGRCWPTCASAAAGCSSSASAAAPANCSHAVNDFRKIAGIEAYAPTDNVSELTARTNDEGWDTVFVEWLKGSRLRAGRRRVRVLGRRRQPREEHQPEPRPRAASTPRRSAPRSSASSAATAATPPQVADACVIVPTVNPETVTPHTRGVPGRGLAPARLASAAQDGGDQMGVDGGEHARRVFLDRDGVINRAIVRDGRPYPPATLEELEILPGRAEALAAAEARGLRAGRGHQPAGRRARDARRARPSRRSRAARAAAADRRDSRLLSRRCATTALAASRSRAAADAARAALTIDSRSFMVGDRWRDIEAGRRAGCRGQSSSITATTSRLRREPDVARALASRSRRLDSVSRTTRD